MISLTDYWMGRDDSHEHALTETIRMNARETVRRANALLAMMIADGLLLEAGPDTGSIVTSGWRPPEINARTRGAAARSRHITAQAIDLHDPEGQLDDWCMYNPDALAEIGLWLEHPAATKGWCHLQTVPPRSGRRVFYP